LALLSQLERYLKPYPYVHCGEIDRALLDSLDRSLGQVTQWQRYDRFYRCWISTPQRVPDSQWVPVVEHLVEIPLSPLVHLTFQRMAPGDGAAPHTDRPLLGFESARLIIQLTPEWTPCDAGQFQVHPDPDGARVTRTHAPLRGTAIAMALRPTSVHSVQDCGASRLSAVFHFFHAANTPALAEQLRLLFSDLVFSELPAAVHPLMDAAEASLSEDTTLRAGLVAAALARWESPTEVVCAGYEASLLPLEEGGPFLAARWLAHLWTTHFDLDQWSELAPLARRDPHCPQALRNLAFPGDLAAEDRG
jgi:hypothetical protein